MRKEDSIAKDLFIVFVIILFSAAISKCFSQQCYVTSEMEAMYKQPITEGYVPHKFVQEHCITIYLETDYFTVQSFGGNKLLTEQWMRSLWDSVALLFQNEDLTISVTEVNIPDGPTYGDTMANLNLTSLLYEFSIQAGDDVNGRFKHFMSRRNWSGGIAFVGGYCGPRSGLYNAMGLFAYYGPYAVSGSLDGNIEPIANNPWNYIVLAHEMGHNLGLHHTQSCEWGPNNDKKIDDCVSGGVCDYVQPIERSTIMSYCHLSSYGIDLLGKGFGTEPGNRMRENIESSTCFNFSSGLLTLTGLITGNEYQADEIEIIKGGNTNQGYLTLRADQIEINGPSEWENMQIFKKGCN